MDSSISQQFDAFAWFDRTSPVEALVGSQDSANAVPDTFPFGI
jgi:hypothetical protein